MIKSIECNPNGCGTRFTIPVDMNPIAHEHLEECIKNGWEYKEGIVEKNGNLIIVRCPNCNKEAIRWH